MSLFKNTLAKQSFFKIIHVYGAFVNLRSLVKKHQESVFKEKAIQKLLDNEIDYYSCVNSGISSDEITKISGYIENILIENKETLINNLIESEKYYKKLKHQFKNDFSVELNNEMLMNLEEHIHFESIKKNESLKQNDAIGSYKEEIISFLNYSFGAGDRTQKIASNLFFRNIIDKYNITYNKEHIYSILNILEDEKKYKVTETDILVIRELIFNFLNHVTSNDMNNPDLFMINSDNKFNVDKVNVSKNIILKSIQKYKSLLSKLSNI